MTTGTAGNIVQLGFEDACLCPLGQTVNANQLARGINRLNDILALWATQGLKLWLQAPVSVPLVSGKNAYVLGPSGDLVMPRPLQVLQGTYLTAQGTRQPLTVMSRDEWTRLPQYSPPSAINSYFTQKGSTAFTVYFWNTPGDQAATGTCELLLRQSAAGVVLSADSAGFPPEWTIALRWALADELATGQSDSIQQRCSQRAGAYREALEGFDVEDAPTNFQPDSQSQYGYSSFR